MDPNWIGYDHAFYKPVNEASPPPERLLIQAENPAQALAFARFLGPTERVEQVLCLPGAEVWVAP